MFISFLESFKYVGHLIPVVFLRVYLGYFYLNEAILKYGSDYLFRPRLAADIAEWLPSSTAPIAYKAFIEAYVITHWQVFAYGITGLEFLVAVSFLFGFLVRPIAFAAAILSINFALLGGPQIESLYKTFFVVHLMLAWLGAGRCLGFDYYFYKRRRGLWW